MGCYLYGNRLADEHLWPGNTKVSKPREHGEGPLCVRCGLPLGTHQSDDAHDRHRVRTGHGLGTGACVDDCDPGMDKPWWEIEPADQPVRDEGAGGGGT